MINPELVSLDVPIPDDLRHDWRRLIADTGGSFFQTPDWIDAWAATVGRDRGGVAAIWRIGGVLKAVVTLAREVERLHPRLPITVRYWTNAATGSGSADHTGWAIDDTLGPDVVNWLRNYVGQDALVLRNIAELQPAVEKAFSWREVAESPCPRLETDAYLRGQVGSSKLRKTIRYNRRRLTDAGVTFHWYPVGCVTHEIVDDLFELHGDRRGMVGGSSSFKGQDVYALHHRIITVSGEDTGPVAVVARVEDRTVGVLYGFIFGSTFSYFQSGWDPGFSSLSMGSVLVDESIRRAAEFQCEVFDFLRGPEPYKYRFGAKDLIDYDIVSGTGISAKLIAAKYSAKQRRLRRSGPK